MSAKYTSPALITLWKCCLYKRQTDLQTLPCPGNRRRICTSRTIIRRSSDACLCSQNPRWDSIVRGFTFEFLIVAEAMGPSVMRAMGRQNQRNQKRNQAWNVNGATFMRFQDAAFRDVLPVTCWYLSVFLYNGFKMYSIDSSKMIVDSPNSWTWTAYVSRSTGPSVTSSRIPPFTYPVAGRHSCSTEVP